MLLNETGKIEVGLGMMVVVKLELCPARVTFEVPVRLPDGNGAELELGARDVHVGVASQF